MSQLWLRLRRQRGAVMAEAAIAFPVLLMAAIALLQFAVFYHAQNVVTASVQEGARVAAEEDRTVNDGVQYAQTLMTTGLGKTAGDVQLSGIDGGYAVAVEARGSLHLIVPWSFDARLPLFARAVVSKEKFRVGPGSTT